MAKTTRNKPLVKRPAGLESAPRLAEGKRVTISVSTTIEHKRAIMMESYAKGKTCSWAQSLLFMKTYKLPEPEYRATKKDANGKSTK